MYCTQPNYNLKIIFVLLSKYNTFLFLCMYKIIKIDATIMHMKKKYIYIVLNFMIANMMITEGLHGRYL